MRRERAAKGWDHWEGYYSIMLYTGQWLGSRLARYLTYAHLITTRLTRTAGRATESEAEFTPHLCQRISRYPIARRDTLARSKQTAVLLWCSVMGMHVQPCRLPRRHKNIQMLPRYTHRGIVVLDVLRLGDQGGSGSSLVLECRRNLLGFDVVSCQSVDSGLDKNHSASRLGKIWKV